MSQKLCFAFLLAILALTCTAHAQTVPPDPPAIAVSSLDDAFARLQTYVLGQDYTPCQYLDEQVLAAQGHLDQRNALADRLAKILSSDATMDAKVFASEKLYVIATEQQVDTLAPLLTDETLGDLVRYSIERIPGEKVTNALLAALDKATGKARIGIVNSLGARKDADSNNITWYLNGADVDLFRAGIQAIGASADKYAVLALPSFERDVKLESAAAFFNAYVTSLGNREYDNVSQGLFRSFSKSDGLLKEVALVGLARNHDDQAIDAVIRSLKDSNMQVSRAGVGLVASLKGDGVIEKLFTALKEVNGDTKVGLLVALGARGDIEALPVVLQELKSPEHEVRMAAIEAIAALGDAAGTEVLLRFAAAAEGAEKKAAVDALARMQDRFVAKTLASGEKGVSDTVAQTLIDVANTKSHNKGDDYFQVDSLTPKDREKRHQAARVLAIEALGARYATGWFSSIVFLAQDPNNDVATAAIHALGDLATQDTLPDAMVLLNDETDAGRRGELERTIARALTRLGTEGGAADDLLRVLTVARKEETQASALKIIGALGMPKSLDTVRAFAKKDGAVGHAAVLALAAWPDAAPAADLLALLKGGTLNDADAEAVFNGYVRELRLVKAATPDKSVAFFTEALALAKNGGAKRAVIAGIAEIKDKRALDLLEPLLADAGVGKEAAVAMEKVQKLFYEVSASHNTADAKLAMDGDINTRWATNGIQTPGMWFQLDMGRAAALKAIVLDTSRSKTDYPRSYEAYVFDDPAMLGAPVSSGSNTEAVIEIPLNNAKGRYVRIVNTGTAEGPLWWSIHELRIVPAE